MKLRTIYETKRSEINLLDRLKAIDPKKAEHIEDAFRDLEGDGYWVNFDDEVSTYDPGTHTLHEWTLKDLYKEFKNAKIKE